MKFRDSMRGSVLGPVVATVTWFALGLVGSVFLTSKANAAERDLLTQVEAEARRAVVKEVSYDLKLAFSKGAKGFSGQTTITVVLGDFVSPADNEVGTGLRLDANFKEISEVTINGVATSDFKLGVGYLQLPFHHFVRGTNQISLRYYTEYTRTGYGLQYFQDPVDQKEYLFTNSEPSGAHYFFPCFDQPDLKAQYDVELTLPRDWVGISNSALASTVEVGENSVVTFHRSTPFSTYLLFIGAGDYEVWHSTAGSVPLSIYARKSLAPYVDYENIFEATRKGLEFFNSYFGYPYPFSKYDHIFAPELAPGAMENPGAVTMSEKMIYRGPQSEASYFGRVNTILHEMAHMWFGDLVTMKWWDDLWLNESFATYMSYVAQAEGLQYGEKSWLNFFGIEMWAYWQDQLSTSHPIVTPVADTEASASNFDGITYGKGADVLKQLHFFVGSEAFQKGLQSYFQKYAFRNATHLEFVQEIGDAAGLDLSNWADGWLKSSGLNQVHANWSCQNGVIDSFELKMEPTREGRFLTHRTRVALFEKRATKLQQGDGLKIKHILDVTLSGESQDVPEALGIQCPDLVYPNYGGHGYFLVDLDSRSLELALSGLSQIEDSMTRLAVWGDLGQAVRNGKLKASEYVLLAIEEISTESEPSILSLLIGRSGDLTKIYLRALPLEKRAAFTTDFEELFWRRFENALDESERWVWFEQFLVYSRSAESQGKMRSLLEGTLLDQERRWEVLKHLSRLDHHETDFLLGEELKRDPTSMGHLAAFAARVARPSLESKQEVWKDLTEFSYQSMAKRKEGKWFHDSWRPEISEAFVEPFFELLRTFDWSRVWLVKGLFTSLFPTNICSRILLEKSVESLSAMKNLPDSSLRPWIEANDELRTCITIREGEE